MKPTPRAVPFLCVSSYSYVSPSQDLYINQMMIVSFIHRLLKLSDQYAPAKPAIFHAIPYLYIVVSYSRRLSVVLTYAEVR